MVPWLCLSDFQFKCAQYTCKEIPPCNFQPCKFSLESQSEVAFFLAHESSHYSYIFCRPHSALSYTLTAFSEIARE